MDDQRYAEVEYACPRLEVKYKIFLHIYNCLSSSYGWRFLQMNDLSPLDCPNSRALTS